MVPPLLYPDVSCVAGGASSPSVRTGRRGKLDDWTFENSDLPPENILVSHAEGAELLHRSFCYGDFNDNGQVSVIDVMQVGSRWGTEVGDASYSETHDVNLFGGEPEVERLGDRDDVVTRLDELPVLRVNNATGLMPIRCSGTLQARALPSWRQTWIGDGDIDLAFARRAPGCVLDAAESFRRSVCPAV